MLEEHHVHLGEQGIEKVGSFSQYLPEAHTWKSRPWDRAFGIGDNRNWAIVLRCDGVMDMKGWDLYTILI